MLDKQPKNVDFTNFLPFNDVLNLCYSHRKFGYIIDESSFYKLYFGITWTVFVQNWFRRCY